MTNLEEQFSRSPDFPEHLLRARHLDAARQEWITAVNTTAEGYCQGQPWWAPKIESMPPSVADEWIFVRTSAALEMTLSLAWH